MFHPLLASASSLTDGQTAAFLAAYFGFLGVVILVSLVFGVIIYWRIASKAGYAGAMSLLMFVPFVNFIIIIMFAFTEWPIERRLREAGLSTLPPGGGSYIPPGGGGYAPPPPSAPPGPYANQWGTTVSAAPPAAVPPPPPRPYLPDPPTPSALPPESL